MKIHILRTPMEEVKRVPDGVRWCFGCRQHLLHEDVLTRPVDRYSYYGPQWHLECTGCGQDRSVFPGEAHCAREPGE